MSNDLTFELHEIPEDTHHDDVIGEHIRTIIIKANQHNCSDIHLEPQDKHFRLRFRIDGLLHDIAIINYDTGLRLSSRLKLMGQLNIAEKRLPQDGRFSLPDYPDLHLRMNSCPTIHGEKIVLRISPHNAKTLALDQLGFSSIQLNMLRSTLHQPQGLILVTGPTGSGKTASLHAILHTLNTPDKHIITIEDPVEKIISGCTQIQVNDAIGLSLNVILRSALRQDPDIIMLGEIRDQETALLAERAANTGHLVLATLHANYAKEAISRLQSLGLLQQRVSSSLSLIVAQRLVRKLCPHCKKQEHPSPNHPLHHLTSNLTHHYIATGCNHCHAGYQGRIGIFEVLPTYSISNTPNHPQKLNNDHAPPFTLNDSCIEKIKLGITTFSEYARVLGEALPYAS